MVRRLQQISDVIWFDPHSGRIGVEVGVGRADEGTVVPGDGEERTAVRRIVEDQGVLARHPRYDDVDAFCRPQTPYVIADDARDAVCPGSGAVADAAGPDAA